MGNLVEFVCVFNLGFLIVSSLVCRCVCVVGCALSVGCLLPCCVFACDAIVWAHPKFGCSGCSARVLDTYLYVVVVVVVVVVAAVVAVSFALSYSFSEGTDYYYICYKM